MRWENANRASERRGARAKPWPHVIAIGDPTDPHFVAVADLLAGESLRCHYFSGAGEAVAASGGWTSDPHVVLLLQSRPGQFLTAEIDALRLRWPLARLVSVAGSWCEGEPRSGRVLDGVYRIPWDAAATRLASELGALLAGRGTLSLPPTATLEERAAQANFAADLSGTVAVAALRPSWAAPVIDALSAAGACAFYWPLDGRALARGATAAVWDIAGCEARLAEFRALLPVLAERSPVVALADFPRPEDAAALGKLKVTRVLGKPVAICDLIGALGAVAQRQGRAAA